MIISMYQASVPRLVNILGNLSNILDKAQTHVDAKRLNAGRCDQPKLTKRRFSRHNKLT